MSRENQIGWTVIAILAAVGAYLSLSHPDLSHWYLIPGYLVLVCLLGILMVFLEVREEFYGGQLR